jgi:peptidoglycan/LPS O-acetylase OafA/YrhL
MRDNNFDFLRLSMAVLVIFSHSFLVATGRQLGGMPDAVSLGTLAVAVFFAVSGYLIAQSWERSRSPLDYARRRVFRIYPGFLVAFALSVIVFARLGTVGAVPPFTPADARHWAVRTVLLHDVPVHTAFVANPMPGMVNGSLWTIRYEFWCYVGIAVIGMAGLLSRTPVLILFLLGYAADAAVQSGFHPSWPARLDLVIGNPSLWPRFLAWFLGGTLAYQFRDRFRYRDSVAVAGLLAVLATMLAGGGSTYVWPIAVPYLAFWFAFHPKLNLHRTVERLGGDYSYGTYLYAFPIQQLLVMKGCIGHPIVVFLLATPLTLVVAFLSWRLVERPFLKRKVARKPESAPSSDLVAAP